MKTDIRLLNKKEKKAVKIYEFTREALAYMGLIPKEYLLLGKPFNKSNFDSIKNEN